MTETILKVAISLAHLQNAKSIFYRQLLHVTSQGLVTLGTNFSKPLRRLWNVALLCEGGRGRSQQPSLTVSQQPCPPARGGLWIVATRQANGGLDLTAVPQIGKN